MTKPAKLDPADDWPESHLKISLSQLLSAKSPELERWVRSTPRRSLSPSGQRLMIARQRSWPGPQAGVVNCAPTSEREAIWSFDLIHPTGFSRIALPRGTGVDAIQMLDESRAAVTLHCSADLARELGLLTPTLQATLTLASLHGLPDPPHNEKSVPALCDLLFSAGVAQGRIGEVATAYRNERRRLDAERKEATARRHAQVWANCKNRTASDLGSLAQRFVEEVRATGLVGLADDLARLARLCVAAAESGPGEEAPVGGSRIGGAPDLPSKMPWPEVEGELLSFILQIDLAQVPLEARGALPESGVLALFLGSNECTTDVEHRLLLLEPGALVRRSPPKKARYRDESTAELEPVSMSLCLGVSLPDYESAELDALLARHAGLEEGLEKYFELQRRLLPEGDVTRLLSCPASREAAEHAAKAAGSVAHPSEVEWVPLLRVASHRAAGLAFWDAGELDVLIPRSALDLSDFDRTYAEITTG
jgi:hypothetical protein